MNKHAQQRVKDTKASGLKISFKISNTTNAQRTKNTKLSFRSQDLISDLKYEQTCPAGGKRQKRLRFQDCV